MTDEEKKRRILELLDRGQKYKQIVWELGFKNQTDLIKEMDRLGIPGRTSPFFKERNK